MNAPARKPASARGLFRATGKAAKPVMVDLVGGEAVYADDVAREADDFYPTPPEPIRAFLHAEGARIRALGGPIWEPAAGDGALAREMHAAGFDTICSDLIDRGGGATIRSFYDYAEAPSGIIVTNPPWGEAAQWIAHARQRLGVPYLALLLPWKMPAAATTVGPLWDADPPARVYLMRWRIDWTGAGGNPSNDAWFVWDGRAALGETRLLMLDRKDARQGELFA